jgi:hypothetical protein
MKHPLHSLIILGFSLFIITLSNTSAPAQYPSENRDESARQRAEEARRREMDRARRDIQTPRHRSPYKEPDYYMKKMTVAQKKLLAASIEDQAAFANFLRQSNTGLVRLLPKGKYEFSETVAANADPDTILPIKGGGAFYSFTEKSHSLGPWSEISLQDDKLVTGFTSESLGLITSLGDVPLETLSLNTAGVEYLAGLTPPTRYMDAHQQRKNNLNGISVGSLTYQSIFPATANTTYVLRSIAYKKEGMLNPYTDRGQWDPKRPPQDLYIPHPEEYEGADVLIAFRIVRKDADGSVVVLWKRLKKFSAPKLKADFKK